MRILIVEVNWLGDVLFSTPAIKALRRKFPDSFIACMVVPRVKEVLQGNPDINEIIINDEDGIHKGFSGKLNLAQELKARNFDLAVLFHRSFGRTVITWQAGIRRRLGYSTWKRRFLLTERLAMPAKDSLHRVDYYLNIVKPLGCDTQDRYYEFFTSGEDEAFIDNFLKEQGIVRGDFVVCLNPGGNWPPKRWPKENFARLADCLLGDYKFKVIFTGAKQDLGLISEIRSAMKFEPIVAAGKTTLRQAACLFKKSNLVISGDSGPLHIASGVGLDIIALFGPTSPRVTGPIGKGRIKIIQKETDCRLPCYDKDCRDNICMQKITVEDVLAEVEGFMHNKRQ